MFAVFDLCACACVCSGVDLCVGVDCLKLVDYRSSWVGGVDKVPLILPLKRPKGISDMPGCLGIKGLF